MAAVNAARELEKRRLKEEAARSAVAQVQALLKMDQVPDRIECFDNSHLAGQDPVSSMVVFNRGRPDKDAYRRYILRDMDRPDDYAGMTQVLTRRFLKTEQEMDFPDLLVVDGGKGQLGMAVAVLKALNLNGRFAVAGLAKKDEAKGEDMDKIYVPGRANPLNTAPFKQGLFLLQQVRDEATGSPSLSSEGAGRNGAACRCWTPFPVSGPNEKNGC